MRSFYQSSTMIIFCLNIVTLAQNGEWIRVEDLAELVLVNMERSRQFREILVRWKQKDLFFVPIYSILYLRNSGSHYFWFGYILVGFPQNIQVKMVLFLLFILFSGNLTYSFQKVGCKIFMSDYIYFASLLKNDI